MLEMLTNLATRHGDELQLAWFDPAFRWKAEVKTILDQIEFVKEYRGLHLDSRSILEIRQPRRKRRQYTMNELLSTNELFPIVSSKAFVSPLIDDDQNLILELTHGTGLLGRYEVESLNLFELEFETLKPATSNLTTAFLMGSSRRNLKCMTDDFLVRRHELLIT